MYLTSFFGLGVRHIVDLNMTATGVVTDVSTCWWLKVNTAPIRTMSGARYPHIVRFSYIVDGTEYSASRFLNWQNNPPAVGRKFRLYYDPANPKKFAVPVF